MLVALLSSIDPVADHADHPRAHLRVAGQTVLERQVRIALAIGCERVVCVAQGLPPELIKVQHLVEREGKRFHAIAGTRALAGLVTVADEILAIADGLLVDPALARLHVHVGRGILALPGELAIPAGHERIDRDRAWAGLLRVPAGDVERLNELPADIDPISALMRVSVQRGRPIVDLPPEVLTDKRLEFVDSETAARGAGRRVVDACLHPAPWTAPAHALVDRSVRAAAPELLSRPAIGAVLFFGSVLLGAIALAASWYAAPAVGIGCLAGAAALSRYGDRLAQIAQASNGWIGRHRERLIAAALDLLLLAILLIAMPRSAWGRALFLLAMLLGLVRLAGIYGPRWLAQAASDRVALFILLTLGAMLNALGIAFQVLALLILAALLIVGKDARITRA